MNNDRIAAAYGIKMAKPKKKKKATKKKIRGTATLVHRIAISLHAEAETLQKKTAWLVKALEASA